MTSNHPMRWELTLESLDPVSVGSGRSRGFHTSTHPYLPGGALRGALASVWMARNGDPGESPAAFADQVLNLTVGPGLPGSASQVPLSRLVCKYRPEPSCRYWSAEIGSGGADHIKCDECGGRSEKSKGQWLDANIERSTRVTLTDDETAAEGQLFSRDALGSGQRFRAVAFGDLSWLSGNSTVRVGGRRTVGGRMALTVQEQTATDGCEPNLVDKHTNLIRIRAQAPVVLLDVFGRNTLLPKPTDLADCLGLADPGEITQVRSFVRPETVGGWNAAARLPKSTEVASCPGSVYEVHLATPVSIAAAQESAERNGLGIRRKDGYGWVTTRPWQGPSKPEDASGQGIAREAIKLAKAVRAAGGSDFVRQCSGWLRDRKLVSDVKQRAAFNGLTPDARELVVKVLEHNLGKTPDLDRRRLILALEAAASSGDMG